MALTIAEFAAGAVTGAGPSRAFPAPQEPYLQLTVVSSAGSTASQSTVSLTGNSNLVTLTSGNAGQCFFFFAASSTGTSTQVTSTNVEVMPPSVQIIRGCKPLAKIFAYST